MDSMKRSCSRSSHHSDKSFVSRYRGRKGGSESDESDIDDELLECQSTLITSNLAITTGLMALITGELALQSEKMALEVGQVALQAGRAALTCDALEAQMKKQFTHTRKNNTPRERSTSRMRNGENGAKRKRSEKSTDRGVVVRDVNIFAPTPVEQTDSKRHKSKRTTATFRPAKHISWSANAAVNTYFNDGDDLSCTSESSVDSIQSTRQAVTFISSPQCAELTERFLVDSVDLANSRANLTRFYSRDNLNSISDLEGAKEIERVDRRLISPDDIESSSPFNTETHEDTETLSKAETLEHPNSHTERLLNEVIDALSDRQKTPSHDLPESTIDSGLSAVDDYDTDSRSGVLSVLSDATLTASRCEYSNEPDSLCTQSITSDATYFTVEDSCRSEAEDVSVEPTRCREEHAKTTSNTIEKSPQIDHSQSVSQSEPAKAATDDGHQVSTVSAIQLEPSLTVESRVSMDSQASQDQRKEAMISQERPSASETFQAKEIESEPVKVECLPKADSPNVGVKTDVPSDSGSHGVKKEKSKSMKGAKSEKKSEAEVKSQRPSDDSVEKEALNSRDETRSAYGIESNNSHEKDINDPCELIESNEKRPHSVDTVEIFMSGDLISFQVKEENCTREVKPARGKRVINGAQKDTKKVESECATEKDGEIITEGGMRSSEESKKTLQDDPKRSEDTAEQKKESSHEKSTESKNSLDSSKKADESTQVKDVDSKSKKKKKKSDAEESSVVTVETAEITIQSEAMISRVPSVDSAPKAKKGAKSTKEAKPVETAIITINSAAIVVTVDASCVVKEEKKPLKKARRLQSTQLTLEGETQVHKVDEKCLVSEMNDEAHSSEQEREQMKETKRKEEKVQSVIKEDLVEDKSPSMDTMSRGKAVEWTHRKELNEECAKKNEATCPRESRESTDHLSKRGHKRLETVSYCGDFDRRSERSVIKSSDHKVNVITARATVSRPFRSSSSEYLSSDSYTRVNRSFVSRSPVKINVSSSRETSSIAHSSLMTRARARDIKIFDWKPSRATNVHFDTSTDKYSPRKMRQCTRLTSYSAMNLPSLYSQRDDTTHRSYLHMNKVLREIEECKDRIRKLKHIASAQRKNFTLNRSVSFDCISNRHVAHQPRDRLSQFKSSLCLSTPYNAEYTSGRISPVPKNSFERHSRYDAHRSVTNRTRSPVTIDLKSSRCSSEISRRSHRHTYSNSAAASSVHTRAYSEIRISRRDVSSSWSRLRSRVDQAYPNYWSTRQKSVEISPQSVDVLRVSIGSRSKSRERRRVVTPDSTSRPSLTRSATITSIFPSKIVSASRANRVSRSPSVLDRDIDDIDYHIWCARVHAEEAESRQRYVLGSRTTSPSYSRYMPQRSQEVTSVKSDIKLTINQPSMAPSPSIKHQLTSEMSEELPDSPVIKTLPLKAMQLKQTDSTETNDSPATKASPPEVVDITRLQEHDLSPVVEYGGNLSHSHQARVGVSPTEMTVQLKSREEIEKEETLEDQVAYDNSAFAGTDKIDSSEERVSTGGAFSPYEVNRSEILEKQSHFSSTEDAGLPREGSVESTVLSPESDLTPVKATTIAQTIVEQVIEEAKIKSAQTTPAHQGRASEGESHEGPSLEEAQALAQDIVYNVIEEVKTKFASTGVTSDDTPPPQVQLRSPKKRELVKITKTEASGDTPVGESPAEEVYYSDGRSPGYSRPTSGELDINLFLGASGTASSSAGAGSSEYETCVTSQSTTFKSAVTSQDTSYATARSSLSSQQSSSRSTLIEDSESSGHLGEMSSEASETIITEDRDLNTPMAEELDDEVSDPTAFMVSLHKTYAAPQSLPLEGSTRGPSEVMSSRPLDEAEKARKDSLEGHAASITSPGQGSVGSIDLPSGASLPSHSSVSSNLSDRTRLQLLCDLSPESPGRLTFVGDGDRPVSPIPPDDQMSQPIHLQSSLAGQVADSPSSDDTDNMCMLGNNDLYTHPEVDEEEDLSSKADRPSSVDAKMKVKYRLSGSFADSASTSSSLQEFERLETELMNKGSNLSLSSTPQRTPQKGQSGQEKDDMSLSSLSEFEKLEHECHSTSQKTSPVGDKKLTEIEEGHESQASDSGETITGQDSESIRTRISNVNLLMGRDSQSLDLTSDSEESASENALAASTMDTSNSSLQEQLNSFSYGSGAPSLEPVAEKVEEDDDDDDADESNKQSASASAPGPYTDCMLASVTSVDTADALNSSFISQGTMVSSSEIVDFTPPSQPKLLLSCTPKQPEIQQ